VYNVRQRALSDYGSRTVDHCLRDMLMLHALQVRALLAVHIGSMRAWGRIQPNE